MADDFDWSWYPAERDARLIKRIEAATEGDNAEGRKVLRDCIAFLKDIQPVPEPISYLIERLTAALEVSADEIPDAMKVNRGAGRPPRNEIFGRTQIQVAIETLQVDNYVTHPLGSYLNEILTNALEVSSKKVSQTMHISPPTNRPLGKRDTRCFEHYAEWLIGKTKSDGTENLPNNDQMAEEFLDYLNTIEETFDIDKGTVRGWLKKSRPGLPLLEVFDLVESMEAPPGKQNQ